MLMFSKIQLQLDRLLEFLKLKPLSLAGKCRLQFGGAVLLIIALALSIPYLWMAKLTEKIAFDAGRAVADTVFEKHLQVERKDEKRLPMLEDTGAVRKDENHAVRWLRIDADAQVASELDEKQIEVLEMLKVDENRNDFAWTDVSVSPPKNNYIRIVRATESCITCHSTEGTAGAFNKNQEIGAIVVQTPARAIAYNIFMNRFWTVIAGLLAATGAMVAFYTIAQRIILRPIRQLRALVNNVAEGNLDARSAIKSNDEYEKLSDAFNEMLDGLQESQQKLRQANQQLDAKIAQLSDRNIELFKANKLKSEFLANMSHEFRTPLNAILGFAQLLREKPAENVEKSVRYAENIIASGRSLLNMINDLLDLAKAQAGKMYLKIEKTNIQQLCQSLVAFFSPLTDEKALKVSLDISEDIPLIQTDSGKVQQILYNLLSNAVKFTPQDGRIDITAKMFDDKTVRISVVDTGPGITPENKAKIFEKFRQVDGSITRAGSGTGLGLAICKELTSLLAGNISLESEVGKGSAFHLDIPVLLTTDEQQGQEPQEPQE